LAILPFIDAGGTTHRIEGTCGKYHTSFSSLFIQNFQSFSSAILPFIVPSRENSDLSHRNAPTVSLFGSQDSKVTLIQYATPSRATSVKSHPEELQIEEGLVWRGKVNDLPYFKTGCLSFTALSSASLSNRMIISPMPRIALSAMLAQISETPPPRQLGFLAQTTSLLARTFFTS
jgi:hypothetical protein